MNAQVSPELQAIQGALAFETELTAASPKAIAAGHALVKTEGSFMCPIEDILVLDGFNPRIKDEAYYAHVRSIADSMKEEGYYLDKPLAGFGALLGKKPVIYVTEGHCRLAAVKLAVEEGAPITEVPLVLKDKSTTMEDLLVALVRGNDGKRFSPLELAVVCKRLTSFHWKADKIAAKLGITAEYVGQLLTLAGAPHAIREMVQAGQATAAVAIGAIRQHGEQAGAVLGDALKVAEATGKSKVTNKFMPSQVRRVTLTKAAPKMFEALEQVKSNQAYASLPTELQQLIADLVATVQQAVKPEVPATSAAE